MENAARRSGGGGIFDALYKLLMRRNSVYVTFIIAGAFAGERGGPLYTMFEGDKIESLMHPLDGVSVLHVADRKELGADILAYAVSVCKAVDYGVHKLWEYNNVGKRYEDIPVLGQRQSEE